jgi:GntR family transcriptional regulator
MASEESFVPIYHRLERYLRDRMRDGTLKPGDAIPSESQLAKQFQTSRVTVRHALSRLVFEGLIVRHRGRGSFVAEPRFQHTNSMFWSFDDEMKARGLSVSHKLLTMARGQAEGKAADALKIPEGTLVCRLERLGFVDGLVVVYEIRYLPLAIADQLTPDEIERGSLVTALARVLGGQPSRIVIRVTASAARAHEANVLQTRFGAPVLVREHVWYLDTPISYGKAIYRGDRYEMSVEFSEPRS